MPRGAAARPRGDLGFFFLGCVEWMNVARCRLSPLAPMKKPIKRRGWLLSAQRFTQPAVLARGRRATFHVERTTSTLSTPSTTSTPNSPSDVSNINDLGKPLVLLVPLVRLVLVVRLVQMRSSGCCDRDDVLRLLLFVLVILGLGHDLKIALTVLSHHAVAVMAVEHVG